MSDITDTCQISQTHVRYHRRKLECLESLSGLLREPSRCVATRPGSSTGEQKGRGEGGGGRQGGGVFNWFWGSRDEGGGTLPLVRPGEALSLSLCRRRLGSLASWRPLGGGPWPSSMLTMSMRSMLFRAVYKLSTAQRERDRKSVV